MQNTITPLLQYDMQKRDNFTIKISCKALIFCMVEFSEYACLLKRHYFTDIFSDNIKFEINDGSVFNPAKICLVVGMKMAHQ